MSKLKVKQLNIMKIFIVVFLMIISIPAIAQKDNSPTKQEESNSKKLSLKNLRISDKDTFEGTKTYTLKPIYFDLSSNPISVYIKIHESTKKAKLYFRFHCNDSQWVFYNKIQFRFYDKNLNECNMEFPVENKSEDVSGSFIIESSSYTPSVSEIDYLLTMSDKKDALLRFSGKSYNNTSMNSFIIRDFTKILRVFKAIQSEYKLENKQ